MSGSANARIQATCMRTIAHLMSNTPPRSRAKSPSSIALVPSEVIQQRILVIRGHKVMLDNDLAELYGVETKRLTEAVKRNLDRFPDDFMFQLDAAEFATLRSQFCDLKRGRSCSGPELEVAICDLKWQRWSPAPALCVHRARGGHAVERAPQQAGRCRQHRNRASLRPQDRCPRRTPWHPRCADSPDHRCNPAAHGTSAAEAKTPDRLCTTKRVRTVSAPTATSTTCRCARCPHAARSALATPALPVASRRAACAACHRASSRQRQSRP